jgi:hypothetical protein
MDLLQADLQETISKPGNLSREEIFSEIVEKVRLAGGSVSRERASRTADRPVTLIPQMNEPWYCCAEPTDEQIAPY